MLELAEESSVFQATVSDPVNLPRLDAALVARQSDSFDILNQRKKKMTAVASAAVASFGVVIDPPDPLAPAETLDRCCTMLVVEIVDQFAHKKRKATEVAFLNSYLKSLIA